MLLQLQNAVHAIPCRKHAQHRCNTVFVAAADHTPPIGVGHSAIIDPTGVVRASIGTTTGLALADVSLDDVERVRRVNPALQLRRYTVVPREI